MICDVIIKIDSGEVIHISEGDGSNLFEEDIDQGYIDYIYYTIFDPEEIDGGMILLTEYFQDKYTSVEQLVNDVLEFIYPAAEPNKIKYEVLEGGGMV